MPKISALPPATTINADDDIPILQSGVTKKIPFSSLVLPADQSSFLQSGTGAVARTVQSKERDIVSVKDFGAVGDGVTNDYASVAAAIAALPATGGLLLFKPGDSYKINSQLALPTASKDFTICAYGATLDFSGLGNGVSAITTNNHTGNGTNSYFNWFGGIIVGKGATSSHGFDVANATNQQQVGITLRDMVFSAFGGGAGIHANRCFHPLFDNINVESCSYGAIIEDTGGLVTSDACYFNNLMAQNCTNDGVSLRRGSGHTFHKCQFIGNGGWGINIAPAANGGAPYCIGPVSIEDSYFEVNTSGGIQMQGTAATGEDTLNITVRKNTFLSGQHVLWNTGANHDNDEFSGNWLSSANLTLSGASVRYARVFGNTLIGTATFTDSGLGTNTALNNVATNKAQPCFAAYLTSTAANATGDGTAVTLTGFTSVYDQHSDFTIASGTFTAPAAGKYLLMMQVELDSLGAGHTKLAAQIITTARTWAAGSGSAISPAAVRSSDNIYSFQYSAICDMSAGDTATFAVAVANSTKTVAIQGTGISHTFVSGYKVT